MPTSQYKIGIVGAGTLLGKELSETMAESALGAAEIVLLDEGDALGELTTAGDEVTFIQRLEKSAFERMDFVFFACLPELTLLHWREAVAAGALVIDLSGALEHDPTVPVMAPAVMQAVAKETDADLSALGFNLQTNAVVPAHPAAGMLALLFAKLGALPLKSIAVTLLEPASQYGRAAMDELHQQTVNLLSFQSLPRSQYDAQIAFNLLAVPGEAANVAMKTSEKRIRASYERLNATLPGPGKLPALAMQLSQAPAFHGYTASVLLEFSAPVGAAEIETALSSERIEVVEDDADAPSNLSAAGQEKLLVRIHPEQELTRSWLWVAADNLKLASMDAIACALEMRRLRPSRQVQ
jgi:aspartate-semialdehyde dehydrogenase